MHSSHPLGRHLPRWHVASHVAKLATFRQRQKLRGRLYTAPKFKGQERPASARQQKAKTEPIRFSSISFSNQPKHRVWLPDPDLECKRRASKRGTNINPGFAS